MIAAAAISRRTWFYFLEEVLRQDHNGSVRCADVLQDLSLVHAYCFVNGHLGDIEYGFLSERIATLLLQEVEPLVEHRPEHVGEVTLD